MAARARTRSKRASGGDRDAGAGAVEETFDDHLCWLLSRAQHALLTEIAAALEQVDLSPRMHEALAAARGRERTQTELVRATGLDKTTMVVTLDELEAAGLAERRPSATDRRARVVAVTPAGERVLRRADALIHDVHEDVLAALPARDRDAFVRSLVTLVGGRLSTPVATAQPVRRRTARA